MNELLTITEHADIIVSKIRDIKNSVISEEDRNLLFDVVYKDKKGKSRYIFSHNGKNKIKACSIVGSISIKNGLTIEILPKFARGHLTEESKKSHRKTLINIIRVSNEKNFITSHSQSSKIPMGEMPLTNYIIELFTVSLLDSLRQGIYATYTKEINNSSYIKGNILVSKTMQNNFIDKSKVYTSYNKQSANNLLMQVFRTLSKILIQDENLSYTARQNLHEIYLLLDGVEIINLKSEDFERVVFNRLNDKYEILFNQASFIYNKYMPFSSKVNATPFWSILFDMDYLFEKFIAYLFRKSDIKFKEQNTTDCFRNLDKIVSVRPDFVIKNVNKEVISVVDAKWKLLTYKESLYGLNAQNFWQLFSYMNLINKKEQISGYFIVPKNSDNFEDDIEFESFIDGNKSINILSIDFSLDFEDIINSYRYKIENNKLEVDYQVADIYKDKRIFAKPISLENLKQFEFIGFIADKTIIYLKKIDDTYQYFSTDSNLLESLPLNKSIFKNSLENCVSNFLQLHKQKTLYFSSIDIKNKLFSDIIEVNSFNEKNNVIITSTDYSSKISMNLRTNEFFYFAIDFYDSFDNKVKNLYHENETIMDKLVNDFYTLKNKEQIFNEINKYKEQLKKENKNSDTRDVSHLRINKMLIDESIEKVYKPLEEKEIEQCYSDHEDELLDLANNKYIKDELKIILFYREYKDREIKEKIQEIILCNASTDLKNLLETKIKELVKVLENKFSSISSKYENWLYGFIYANNNNYIYTIKEIIGQHTKSIKMIEILSNEEERKILSSILHNFNNVDNKFLVTNEILTKILAYAIKTKNIKIALEILERKEITLKLVQEVVKNFKTYEDKSESSKKTYVVIKLVKETIYDDKSIQAWISEIDRFNFDNYSTLSIDDKMDFAVEAQFQYYNNDLIKKFCYENNEDILVDIATDKHNTLQIRFVLLIYILNFKNFAFKEKYLFEAIKNKNNNTLNTIVSLHEKNDISLVVKYIEENFNEIDNEILFGYAMSNNKEVYYIREKICFLTNELDILDEFSKNREDENILLNIIFHTSNNPKFTESIKSNITKYSKETLSRIANYEEYYKINDKYCLIAKVASSFNLSNKTRYDLFNKYKSDRVILDSLNNKSLDYDKNLSNLRSMIKNALDMAENNNFSNYIDVSKIRL